MMRLLPNCAGSLAALLGCFCVTAQENEVPQRVDPLPFVLEKRCEFTIGGGRAYVIAISPDGNLLATSGELGDVKVWNRRTREVLWTRPPVDRPQELAFSHDSQRLAIAGASLTIWSADTGRMQHEIAPGGVRAVAFAPDDSLLAYGAGARGEVFVVRTSDWSLHRAFEDRARDSVQCVAFGREADTVLAGDGDGQVWSLDLATGDERVLRRHGVAPSHVGRTVNALAWAGERLMSACWTGEVLIGDTRVQRGEYLHRAAAKGELVATYQPKAGVELFGLDGVRRAHLDVQAADIAFAPDGALAIATEDGRMLDWYGERVRSEFDLRHSSRAERLVFSADSKFLVAAGRCTAFVEVATGVVKTGARLEGVPSTGARDAEVLFFPAGGRQMEVLDASTAKVVARRDIPEGTLWACSVPRLGPGGTALLGSKVLSLTTGTQTDLGFVGWHVAVAWSAAGHLALGGTKGFEGDGGVLIVRSPSGVELLRRDDFTGGIHALSFSPSSRFLVYQHGAGSPDFERAATLHRIDLTTMAKDRSVEAAIGQWWYVDEAFAIADHAGENGCTVEFWDAARLVRLGNLLTGWFGEVEVSPDRTSVAVAWHDHVAVYELRRREPK